MAWNVETQSKEQDTVIQKYKKKTLHNIEYINGVPKVVFVIWLNNYNQKENKMSERRIKAFNSLVNNINVPVILITESNLQNFIKTPLHPAFNYLSGTHKSDYMRVYLLLHYGGGYHDIKFRKESWRNCWGDWLNDNTLWMYGRQEYRESSIGYPPNYKHIKMHYLHMITMGWIICKPNTPYLKRLMYNMNKVLDKHYENLKKNPATKDNNYYRQFIHHSPPKNEYPLKWTELLGELAHPLMLYYTPHIKYGLPDADRTR
jgi:hypothetical protein